MTIQLCVKPDAWAYLLLELTDYWLLEVYNQVNVCLLGDLF